MTAILPAAPFGRARLLRALAALRLPVRRRRAAVAPPDIPLHALEALRRGDDGLPPRLRDHGARAEIFRMPR